MEEWIKRGYSHTVGDAREGNGVSPSAGPPMDLEGVLLRGVCQREMPSDFAYVWSLKNTTNEPTRNK